MRQEHNVLCTMMGEGTVDVQWPEYVKVKCPTNCCSIPRRAKDLPHLSSGTQPANVYWKLFPGIERWGVVLTIHLHLVSWLKMSGATPQLCHITSRHAVGHLYLYMVQALQLYDLLSIKTYYKILLCGPRCT